MIKAQFGLASRTSLVGLVTSTTDVRNFSMDYKKDLAGLAGYEWVVR